MKTFIQLPFRLTALVAAAALVSFSVSAETVASSTTLKHGDRSFIEKAAKSGMEEAEISQVALTRTADTQVRELAQMMVTDHTAANTELGSLAASKGVVLPVRTESAADKWLKKDAKDAKDFDEDYVAKMVSAHKDAVELFEKEAKHGDDPDVVAFAAKTLPKLQHHLEMAQSLKKIVK